MGKTMSSTCVKQVFMFNTKTTYFQPKSSKESLKIALENYNNFICLYFHTIFENNFLGYFVENIHIPNQDILISIL